MSFTINNDVKEVSDVSYDIIIDSDTKSYTLKLKRDIEDVSMHIIAKDYDYVTIDGNGFCIILTKNEDYYDLCYNNPNSSFSLMYTRSDTDERSVDKGNIILKNICIDKKDGKPLIFLDSHVKQIKILDCIFKTNFYNDVSSTKYDKLDLSYNKSGMIVTTTEFHNASVTESVNVDYCCFFSNIGINSYNNNGVGTIVNIKSTLSMKFTGCYLSGSIYPFSVGFSNHECTISSCYITGILQYSYIGTTHYIAKHPFTSNSGSKIWSCYLDLHIYNTIDVDGIIINDFIFNDVYDVLPEGPIITDLYLIIANTISTKNDANRYGLYDIDKWSETKSRFVDDTFGMIFSKYPLLKEFRDETRWDVNLYQNYNATPIHKIFIDSGSLHIRTSILKKLSLDDSNLMKYRDNVDLSNCEFDDFYISTHYVPLKYVVSVEAQYMMNIVSMYGPTKTTHTPKSNETNIFLIKNHDPEDNSMNTFKYKESIYDKLESDNRDYYTEGIFNKMFLILPNYRYIIRAYDDTSNSRLDPSNILLQCYETKSSDGITIECSQDNIGDTNKYYSGNIRFMVSSELANKHIEIIYKDYYQSTHTKSTSSVVFKVIDSQIETSDPNTWKSYVNNYNKSSMRQLVKHAVGNEVEQSRRTTGIDSADTRLEQKQGNNLIALFQMNQLLLLYKEDNDNHKIKQFMTFVNRMDTITEFTPYIPNTNMKYRIIDVIASEEFTKRDFENNSYTTIESILKYLTHNHNNPNVNYYLQYLLYVYSNKNTINKLRYLPDMYDVRKSIPSSSFNKLINNITKIINTLSFKSGSSIPYADNIESTLDTYSDDSEDDVETLLFFYETLLNREFMNLYTLKNNNKYGIEIIFPLGKKVSKNKMIENAKTIQTQSYLKYKYFQINNLFISNSSDTEVTFNQYKMFYVYSLYGAIYVDIINNYNNFTQLNYTMLQFIKCSPRDIESDENIKVDDTNISIYFRNRILTINNNNPVFSKFTYYFYVHYGNMYAYRLTQDIAITNNNTSAINTLMYASPSLKKILESPESETIVGVIYGDNYSEKTGLFIHIDDITSGWSMIISRDDNRWNFNYKNKIEVNNNSLNVSVNVLHKLEHYKNNVYFIYIYKTCTGKCNKYFTYDKTTYYFDSDTSFNLVHNDDRYSTDFTVTSLKKNADHEWKLSETDVSGVYATYNYILNDDIDKNIDKNINNDGIIVFTNKNYNDFTRWFIHTENVRFP